MSDDLLIHARKRAERAVQGMSEGPLKTAAFQTILAKLLADLDPAQEVQPTTDKKVASGLKQPDTLTGRILMIKTEGFFKIQRSLSEVREGLGSRGWHYPLTTLSGAMQAIVRQRQLRRERVTTGKRKAWKYSNA
jgi:hypothetical protein